MARAPTFSLEQRGFGAAPEADAAAARGFRCFALALPLASLALPAYGKGTVLRGTAGGRRRTGMSTAKS